VNIPYNFHPGCSIRSFDIVVTRLVQMNKQTNRLSGQTARKHNNAFADNVGWRNH